MKDYILLDGVDISCMTQGDIEYYNRVAFIAEQFGQDVKPEGRLCSDTLVALVENGPLGDGDVPSKRGRDDLITNLCASKIIVKGEDGMNAATYFGRDVYKYLFGKSDSIAEARAFRQANRMIRSAKHSQ